VRAKDRKEERARIEQQQRLERLVLHHPLVLRAVLDGWRLGSVIASPRCIAATFTKIGTGLLVRLEFATTDGALLSRQAARLMGLSVDDPADPDDYEPKISDLNWGYDVEF
jgi:hypothetical protein